MIRAILFDLDDTLYLENDYYCSGFCAAAQELESRGVGPAAQVRQALEAIHYSEGPANVIDKAAARIPFPEEWVPELVDVVRSHRPRLSLAPDAADTLPELRGRYRLGCITDGYAGVQRRKIDALGLTALVDTTVFSDDFGRQYWKPHVRPYLACCERLRLAPEQCAFVGDSPQRDVRGARRAGMMAIRIRRKGSYSFDVSSQPPDLPDFEIASLSELAPVLDRGRREVKDARDGTSGL